MSHVPARREHPVDNAKIAERGRINIEDCEPLGPPERNEIETVQAAHNANHVDVFAPGRVHALVVRPDLLKLSERSVLIAIISAIEYVFGMVVIHFPIEGSRR